MEGVCGVVEWFGTCDSCCDSEGGDFFPALRIMEVVRKGLVGHLGLVMWMVGAVRVGSEGAQS